MNMKIHFVNNLKASFLSFIVFATLMNISYAETHYVSPTGSAGWDQSINIATPCSAASSMANAVAGDIVYYRGGQYELFRDPNAPTNYYGYRGLLGPVNSGTINNPITFAAYPGEIPILNANTEGSYIRVLANNDKDYIVFDGFHLTADNGQKMGAAIISSHNINGRVEGNIVRNCTFDGGTIIDSSTANRGGLRIEGTNYTLIQNCRIYNYRETGNNHNTTGIKTYHNDYLVIENNEIYNCSLGIFSKADTQDSIVRYNYIHNCHGTIFVQVFAGTPSNRNSVYHNVIVNNTSSGLAVGLKNGIGDDWNVYNNTFYNNNFGVRFSNGTGWKIWNNIIVGGALSAYGGTTLVESDHNLYGLDNTYIARLHMYEANDATYKSMVSWQFSGELAGGGNPGVGSLVSDPMFVNLSGNMDQLADFALLDGSPCMGTGRGRADMGADIDNVGITTSSATDNTPPKAPIGLTIQ